MNNGQKKIRKTEFDYFQNKPLERRFLKKKNFRILFINIIIERTTRKCLDIKYNYYPFVPQI